MAFTFDPVSQRYRGENGRYLSSATVRRVVDDDIASTKARMQSLARDLQSGKLTSDEFQAGMVQEIKELHLANVALARGGADRMRQSDYGRAGGILKREYRYFQERMARIESDPEYLKSAAMVEHIGMYAEAGRGTFARVKDAEMRDAGFGTKANRLDANSRHCEGENSCVAMTNLGRVAIDDPRYILEGQRICLTKCQCETVYFKAALTQ